MENKKYTTPQFEIKELAVTSILTTSGDGDDIGSFNSDWIGG